jgi:hypothetical protein
MVKNLLRRVAGISALIFFGKYPFRAFSIASMSRSVANICRVRFLVFFKFYKVYLKEMASE